MSNSNCFSFSEEARLRELNGLLILDTPPEPVFDDLVKIASQVCDVPIALISLVAEKRQWFKARVGLDVAETSRQHAFCAHAILQDNLFEVKNTLEDERFCENPLVVGPPNIRFYAGAPLITRTGQRIGTLCVIDREKRELSELQIQVLSMLARQVMTQIERHQMAVLNQQRTRELHLAHSRLFSLVEHLPVGILAEDSSRKVQFANNALCKILGLHVDPNDLLNLSSSAIEASYVSAVLDSKSASARISKILELRQPVTGEVLTIGGTRTVERDYLPIYVQDEYQGQIWLFRDISEKCNAERVIAQQRMKIADSAKLAALGEMAGGVAHEINNPLAIILAEASCLKKVFTDVPIPSEEISASLDRIMSVVMRISKIVKGLRAFARDERGEPFQRVSLGEIIEDTISFCGEKFRAASVILKYAPNSADLFLECRAVQISQVLLNLLNNAFDAVDGLPERWVELSSGSIKDDELYFKVVDSGRGIEHGLQDKIFDPFFTTKPVGKGTGLGLSVSKGIIESHGGTIAITKDAEYTEIVVHLPKSQKNKS